MKIYVYTLTERNWWKDNWETRVTGVADVHILIVMKSKSGKMDH